MKKIKNQPENFKIIKKSPTVITKKGKEDLSNILSPNRKISQEVSQLKNQLIY